MLINKRKKENMKVSDLVKYYPYEMGFKFDGILYQLDSISFDDIIPRTCFVNEDRTPLDIREIKPILRPLNHIIEPIKERGSVYIPLVQLAIHYETFERNNRDSKTVKRFDVECVSKRHYKVSYIATTSRGEILHEFEYIRGLFSKTISSDRNGIKISKALGVEMQNELTELLYRDHFWIKDQQSLFEAGDIIEKPLNND